MSMAVFAHIWPFVAFSMPWGINRMWLQAFTDFFIWFSVLKVT
jgi:hypothetical protein